MRKPHCNNVNLWINISGDQRKGNLGCKKKKKKKKKIKKGDGFHLYIHDSPQLPFLPKPVLCR